MPKPPKSPAAGRTKGAQISKSGHVPIPVQAPKTGHVPITDLQACRINPSPENDTLYGPIDPTDPTITQLSASIGSSGVMEPLIVTADGWIVSGHRRYAAAMLAGLTSLPCRVLPEARTDFTEGQFRKLLRDHNHQREKTRAVRAREALIDANPDEEYRALLAHRESESRVELPAMELGELRKRSAITDAKADFLAAIRDVIAARRAYWPLSLRQVHYALLNDPPLRHARKPDSRYENNEQSYKSLSDLANRARIAGQLPWEAIDDETRPLAKWPLFQSPGSFLTKELTDFAKGYRRNLQQSQPNYIEVICEKLTVKTILQRVCGRYGIPMLTGRGFCSGPPKYHLAARFRRSGKSKLVLLFVTDFDGDGEAIAETFARSMRDEFGVTDIHAVKVALNADQVRSYGLPPGMKAKESSSRTKGFVKKHGDYVYELEALPPAELQAILQRAIDSVLDVESFNAELAAERDDAVHLAGVRHAVQAALADVLNDAA
ncbi:MAG: Chromosome partitioning protein ParB [Phycisphaerales bacterium]|nr:Chromosome partitioning protein ParB [Phycisphaerales bacterium]